MRRFALKLVYMIAWHIGVIRLFYVIRQKRQLVLTYHNIISDEIFDPDLLHLGVSCSRTTFIKQIEIIQGRFRISSQPGDPGSCLITFDDGYANNLLIAAPELSKRRISGLFFIPACYFDDIKTLWIDRLLMWVSYVPPGIYSVLGKNHEITHSHESRRALWGNLYEALLTAYSSKDTLLNELDALYSFAKLSSNIDQKMLSERFTGMTLEDVKKIEAMGHKTGCHSYEHDILSMLDRDQLETDFLMCEKHAGKYNTRYYSYPFGGIKEVNQETVEACRRHNYEAAFINYQANGPDKFMIDRISLDGLHDKYFIDARLSGFEGFIKNTFRPKKRHEEIRG